VLLAAALPAGGAAEAASRASLASSPARCAPTTALFFTSARLAVNDCPPVSSLMRFSRNGVASRPAMRRSVASAAQVCVCGCGRGCVCEYDGGGGRWQLV